jgi:nicotinate phosphoribosyltransferase
MAHEYLQAWQALSPELKDFQKEALQHWLTAYKAHPSLLIALSDVVGIDAFLRDFGPSLTEQYTGCRHDSGDPAIWGEKLICHYLFQGIDPRTKLAVFSDGLTIQSALELAKKFKGKIRTAFGIGTHLTNDFDFQPLNIVIKMTQCNGKPVAKISDSPGKGMCQDAEYLQKLKETFHVQD